MDTTKQYCKVLKGLKPATVVEPNNQEDLTITGLHPQLYTSSQYAWQAQKGRSGGMAYMYIYIHRNFVTSSLFFDVDEVVQMRT